MENVAVVRKKSKGKESRKESRYGRRYGLEFKLRCMKLRLEEGIPVSLLSKEVGASKDVIRRWAKAYQEGGEAGLQNRIVPEGSRRKLPGPVREKIVKIERTDGGDIARSGRVTLFKDGKPCDGEMFLRYNRNKKSVCIDLKNRKGGEIFLDLIKVSDVVVENFRPGVIESMGITYELMTATNPRIIYCTCSGFGRSQTYQGPWSDRPAFDITVQAMSGMLDLVGEKDGPPMFTGIAFGDTIPPIFAAYAIILALHKRERPGKGDFIDIAQHDCLLNTMGFVFTHYSLTGEMLSRGREKELAPWDVYKTSDGYIAILIMEGHNSWHGNVDEVLPSNRQR